MKKKQSYKLLRIFLFVVILGVFANYINKLDWFIIGSIAYLIFCAHLIVDNQIEFGRTKINKSE
ncbi:MAG TPA: hypothetical protein PLO44_02570 [Candidatus Paceibacterota bacterium]|nr:hypothetical protein [Candidatus Paceibacterota bacterium]